MSSRPQAPRLTAIDMFISGPFYTKFDCLFSNPSNPIAMGLESFKMAGFPSQLIEADNGDFNPMASAEPSGSCRR